METPELDVARRMLEAFSRRDRDVMLALCHPEVEFSSITGKVAREGRPYRGRPEIERYLEDVANVWDELRVTPAEYREAATAMVVLGRVYARRGQYVEDSPVGWVMSAEGGLLRSIEVFESPRAALRHAGLAE